MASKILIKIITTFLAWLFQKSNLFSQESNAKLPLFWLSQKQCHANVSLKVLSYENRGVSKLVSIPLIGNTALVQGNRNSCTLRVLQNSLTNRETRKQSNLYSRDRSSLVEKKGVTRELKVLRETTQPEQFIIMLWLLSPVPVTVWYLICHYCCLIHCNNC